MNAMKEEEVLLLAIYSDVATLKGILCQLKRLHARPPADRDKQALFHLNKMERCLHRMETNLQRLNVNDE